MTLIAVLKRQQIFRGKENYGIDLQRSKTYKLLCYANYEGSQEDKQQSNQHEYTYIPTNQQPLICGM